MTKSQLIGFDEALSMTLNNIVPTDSEIVDLVDCVNRVAYEDMKARVDSPSVNASLKDGYAVISSDIEKATIDNPVELKLLGRITPGVQKECEVVNGTALRVLTGSEIPKGADAVLAEEFTKIKNGDNVKVHYTGKLNDGTVFDSSEGRDPLAFTMGKGMMIPGFEKGVMGMALNEEKTITIPPAEAYGDVRQEMIAEVPNSQLPEGLKPEAGMELMSQTPDGHQLVVRVMEVKDDSIVIDANHQLAGKELTFDIKVVEIS